VHKESLLAQIHFGLLTGNEMEDNRETGES